MGRRSFDLTTARRHGDVVFLFEPQDPHPPALSPQVVYAEILASLLDLDFDPNVDIVGLAGSNIYQAVFTAVVVAEFGGGSFLVFDAPRDEYVKRTLQRDATLRSAAE
jgi:hypothetical protein